MRFSKRRKDINMEVESVDQGKESISMEKALSLFLEAQNAMNHSEATKKDYFRVISIFIRYVQKVYEHSSIDQITEADVTGWLSYLKDATSMFGRPYSSRSIETYSRDVYVFFNWLVKHGYLEENPMSLIGRVKVEKALIRVFSEEELKLLDDACERPVKGRSVTPDERKMLCARDRAFLWLLLSTGIRISEACGLRFSDIDWGKELIYVRGKGAKERVVPFGKVARQHLSTYVQYWRGKPAASDEQVFTNVFGAPVNGAGGQEIFNRLRRVSGIKDKRVSAHTCRHWFAVNCIRNGMPTVVLKNILGHENWDMIEVYVRLAEQDNIDLYKRFAPVDTLKMHQVSKDKRQELREWRNARKGKID